MSAAFDAADWIARWVAAGGVYVAWEDRVLIGHAVERSPDLDRLMLEIDPVPERRAAVSALLRARSPTLAPV